MICVILGHINSTVKHLAATVYKTGDNEYKIWLQECNTVHTYGRRQIVSYIRDMIKQEGIEVRYPPEEEAQEIKRLVNGQ